MLVRPETSPSRGERRGPSHLQRVHLMKKMLAALVLGLSLAAAPCNAQCGCVGGSFSHSCGFSFGFKWAAYLRPGCGNSCGGFGDCALSPWYTYWPLEAHFQTPAPTGYPYWPSPMASSLAAPHLQYTAMDYHSPSPGPAYTGAYQTVGFFQQAPSYWYGN